MKSVRKDLQQAATTLRKTSKADRKAKYLYGRASAAENNDEQVAAELEHTLAADNLKQSTAISAERRDEEEEVKTDLDIAEQHHKLGADEKHKHEVGERYAIDGIAAKFMDGEQRYFNAAAQIHQLQESSKTISTRLAEDREQLHQAATTLKEGEIEKNLHSYYSAKARLLHQEARRLDKEAEKANESAIRDSSLARSTRKEARHDLRKEKRMLGRTTSNLIDQRSRDRYAKRDLEAVNTKAEQHGLHIFPHTSQKLGESDATYQPDDAAASRDIDDFDLSHALAQDQDDMGGHI